MKERVDMTFPPSFPSLPPFPPFQQLTENHPTPPLPSIAEGKLDASEKETPQSSSVSSSLPLLVNDHFVSGEEGKLNETEEDTRHYNTDSLYLLLLLSLCTLPPS